MARRVLLSLLLAFPVLGAVMVPGALWPIIAAVAAGTCLALLSPWLVRVGAVGDLPMYIPNP